MLKRTRLILILAVVAGACTHQTPSGAGGSGSPDVAAVKAAIEATNARFLYAFRRATRLG